MEFIRIIKLWNWTLVEVRVRHFSIYCWCVIDYREIMICHTHRKSSFDEVSENILSMVALLLVFLFMVDGEIIAVEQSLWWFQHAFSASVYLFISKISTGNWMNLLLWHSAHWWLHTHNTMMYITCSFANKNGSSEI